MATTTSTGTGSMTNAANWSNGLPDATKDAVIATALTCLIGDSITCLTLTVSAAGSVTMLDPSSITASTTFATITSLGSVSLTPGAANTSIQGNINLVTPSGVDIHGTAAGYGLSTGVWCSTDIRCHDQANGFGLALNAGGGTPNRSAILGMIVVCDKSTGIGTSMIGDFLLPNLPTRYGSIPVSHTELLPTLICAGLRSGVNGNPNETAPSGTLLNPSYLMHVQFASSQAYVVINGPFQYDGADYDFGCWIAGTFAGLILAGATSWTNQVNYSIDPQVQASGIGYVQLGTSLYPMVQTSWGGVVYYSAASGPVADDFCYPIVSLSEVTKPTGPLDTFFGLPGTASGGGGGGGSGGDGGSMRNRGRP